MALLGFTGEIKIFPYASGKEPKGWLLCDGRKLSQQNYWKLYNVLKGKYGESKGTFNIPDLRGRAPVGMSRVGAAGGYEEVVLSNQEIPTHIHEFEATNSLGNDSLVAQNVLGELTSSNAMIKANMYRRDGELDTAMNELSIEGAGGGKAHNNIQPSIGMNFYICAYGIDPASKSPVPDTLVGEIKMLASDEIPIKRYKECDGAAYRNASEMGKLLSVIDTVYGEDGPYFLVPNLLNRVPMGRGQILSTRRELGDYIGDNEVVLNDRNFPEHYHLIKGSTDQSNLTANPSNAFLANVENTFLPYKNNSCDMEYLLKFGTITEYLGYKKPHENRQPYLGVKYVICYDGVYPLRNN